MKAIKKEDLPVLFVYLMLIVMIGGWQYLKFTNGNGIFYFLSQRNGAYILVSICSLAFMIAVVFGRDIYPEKSQSKKDECEDNREKSRSDST